MKGTKRIEFFLCTTLLFVSTLFGEELRLGSQVLTVEIVDKEASRAKGLMGRTSLNEGTGMLFVYPKPQILSFWMKNTLIPLSIGFFDGNRQLTQILDMDPPTGSDLPHYVSESLSQYALEVPKGWFEKQSIHLGETFTISTP